MKNSHWELLKLHTFGFTFTLTQHYCTTMCKTLGSDCSWRKRLVGIVWQQVLFILPKRIKPSFVHVRPCERSSRTGSSLFGLCLLLECMYVAGSSPIGLFHSTEWVDRGTQGIQGELLLMLKLTAAVTASVAEPSAPWSLSNSITDRRKRRETAVALSDLSAADEYWSSSFIRIHTRAYGWDDTWVCVCALWELHVRVLGNIPGDQMTYSHPSPQKNHFPNSQTGRFHIHPSD